MDQNGIFAEYARILRDTESWVKSGWPVPEDEASYTILAMQSSYTVNTSSVPKGNQKSGIARQIKGGIPVRSDYASLSAMFPKPDAVSPGTDNPDKLKQVSTDICSCEKCNLSLTSVNMVPGRGQAGAKLMIVTAPPVSNAREESSPLATNEQDYLNKWLIAMQLDLEKDVFITPALKCGTPGGRAPHPEEAAACAGYLRSQYNAVAPSAVLALGDTACGGLTGNPRDFASLVAREWAWGTIPALILWTPAEVLASPNRLRRPVWEALKKFRGSW